MTKTEICNRALAVLGHDRTISDFDGGPLAFDHDCAVLARGAGVSDADIERPECR